jgi:hypothetical protein
MRKSRTAQRMRQMILRCPDAWAFLLPETSLILRANIEEEHPSCNWRSPRKLQVLQASVA